MGKRGVHVPQKIPGDGRLRAHLLFWNDLARIYATPGADFEVWYARTVGDGVVLP